jgi:prepilin-type N-terminal cleavage/methylation domain-containing protein
MNTTQPSSPGPRRRGFSMIELLVALSISAMLLTAMLSALDAAWRSYKHTTESASTHVVSRIVMHRLLAMIRTGSDFSPFPADTTDPAQNPLATNTMDFVTEADRIAGNNRVTRIERRSAPSGGGYELWLVYLNGATNPPTVTEQYPLLRDVREAVFVMQFDPGPRLRKATIDLTIQPNDFADVRTGLDTETPMIRLVASAGPRD